MPQVRQRREYQLEPRHAASFGMALASARLPRALANAESGNRMTATRLCVEEIVADKAAMPSRCFGGANVYGAADRVLYLYEPAGGYPEYYLLQRYFTPVRGWVARTYLNSARRTAEVLSADPLHGTNLDFKTWAKRTESDWQGVLPRYFRKARQLDWQFTYGEFADQAEAETRFNDDIWRPIHSGQSPDGADGRYVLSTYEQVVDPAWVDWSDATIQGWATKHHWTMSAQFGHRSYKIALKRTHVVVEVLVTDPPDDPLHGTPVPLDLEQHFVSEQA